MLPALWGQILVPEVGELLMRFRSESLRPHLCRQAVEK